MAELSLHHLAIATVDLDGAARWYRDYFSAETRWETDAVSPLTRQRAPGIRRLAEVAAPGMRFHLFEVDAIGSDWTSQRPKGEHYGIAVNGYDELDRYRERWLKLYRTGNYPFRESLPPTEIVTDEAGTSSFYAHDVSGVEFELTHMPR